MISEYKLVEVNDIINNHFAFTYAPAAAPLLPPFHLPLFLVFLLLIFLLLFQSFFICIHYFFFHPSTVSPIIAFLILICALFIISLFLPPPSCPSSFSQSLFLSLSVHFLSCSWLCCCLSSSYSIPAPRVIHSGIRLVVWSCVLFLPFCSSCTSLYFPFPVSWTTFKWCISFSCGASTRFQIMASPYGASRLHSWYTPHLAGLLWKSDRPVAATSTWQHTTLTRDIHASSGIQTHNPSKRAAADPRCRQSGHWDQPYECRLHVQPGLHLQCCNYGDLATGGDRLWVPACVISNR